MAQAFGSSGPGAGRPGGDFRLPDGGGLTRSAGRHPGGWRPGRAAGGSRPGRRGRWIPARRSGGDIGRRWIPARAPAAIGPGGDRPRRRSARARAPAARRSARAAIIGTQKKTPGAGPGARGSRIAAGGSGVELVDQIEHSCEGGLRLVGPAAG
jgi:hypothetical protein